LNYFSWQQRTSSSSSFPATTEERREIDSTPKQQRFLHSKAVNIKDQRKEDL